MSKRRLCAALACAAFLAAAWTSAGEFADPSLGIAEAPLEMPTLRPADGGSVGQQAIFGQTDKVPLFRGEVGGSMDGYMRPLYRTVETATDDIYDLMRRYVVEPLFPGRLSRGLAPSPETDSYGVYRRDLRAKEDRLAAQMLETYPGGVGVNGYYTPQQMLQWQQWAAQQQVSVFIDSFRDAMIERHQLDPFGRFAGDYAKDTDNWDPGFMTMSALVGSAFLYLNGLHSEFAIGDARVGLDLRPGMRVRSAIASRGDPDDLGRVELGWKNKPVVLTADWGARNGHLAADQVGLNYRLRY